MEERLQKILSKLGYGSRRGCEELIATGRVDINGNTAILGSKADPEKDIIRVDHVPVPKINAEKHYYALHKPRGVLSDVNSPDERANVRNLIPVSGHLFAVGRLDFDSEGLMLLTNDGDLANKLTHPRYGHEKEYRVLVARRPDKEQIEIWRRGVVMEDGSKSLPARVDVESMAGQGCWLRIVMREGKKRQIREIGGLIGLPVSRIIRVRIGSLNLGDLKPGEWRRLKSNEIKELVSTSKAPVRKTGISGPKKKL